MRVDLLIHSASQLVTCAAPDGPKRGAALRDVGLVTGGAVAVDDGRIVDAGPSGEILERYEARELVDAAGGVVCPGFVDAHTHVVYAGDRVDEFERRIAGASYREIMASGGGIAATMRAVSGAGPERITAESRSRLDAMLTLGTTTAEVKTGYGPDSESELELLRAIALLDETHAVDLVPTFLGAHAIPPAWQGSSDDYVDEVISRMLPAVEEWYLQSGFGRRAVPLFVDVFCEEGAFDLDQSRRVLEAGRVRGFPLKAHADEFVSLGGVGLAVELEAVSVDHLDVTPPNEVSILAASGTIGVLLPAVTLNLGGTRFADGRALADAGCALALATDYNPGSAPCPSLPLVMALACRYQRLLPAEALNAVTVNAAYAIGLGDRVGSIEAGKQADLLIIDAPDFRHLACEFGGNFVGRVWKSGRRVRGCGR